MHRTTTIVALAASGLFTAATNAQVTFEFQDSGQALGNSHSWAVALGDLDGDGDLDAMVANSSSNQFNSVWINDGNGTFTWSGQASENASPRRPRRPRRRRRPRCHGRERRRAQHRLDQ